MSMRYSECKERALTPRELFNKIDELELDALVIPHGTTWGIHSPANSNISSQLMNDNHDPEKQRLMEVYSGHGNSEIYKNILHIKNCHLEILNALFLLMDLNLVAGERVKL